MIIVYSIKGPEIIRKNNFIINTGDNLTLEQRKIKIQQNKVKYGLNASYIRSLKIPKLLSQSIGHFLTIKQILDDKNNFSIVEKINQLKNLIKCMKKKITIIQKVERKRNERKISVMSGDDDSHSKRDTKKSYVVTLRKLDKDMKNFELIN
jgi:hypothetical protein